MPEPTITATQHDHFYPGNAITIVFSQPMKPTDGDFIFNFSGSGAWSAPDTYTFTPTGLAISQSYTYSVLEGAASALGGVVAADHSYTITTPGAAYLAGSSPSGSKVGLTTPVNLTFDQPVDQASAQAAFSISPNVGGSFSWSGNTMSFHPAGCYTYQTTYSVTLAAGIKAIYGLPSGRPYTIVFTTVLQTLILPIPIYHQDYALSCEEDALSMALAYRGISASDYQVLMQENYAPQPLDTSTNSWGDPNVMFVGDVNGVEGVTGWGSNPAAIAAASIALGRSATVADGITAAGISTAIHNGSPVVLWGYYGSRATLQSWNSPDGVITVARNAHVRTVVGVVSSAPPSDSVSTSTTPSLARLFWMPPRQLIDSATRRPRPEPSRHRKLIIHKIMPSGIRKVSFTKRLC